MTAIDHPKTAIMVIIREDYIELCKTYIKEGEASPDLSCCAAILNYFEHWASKGYEWVYKTQAELKAELFNIWGLNRVSECLNWLVAVGLLLCRNNPKVKWDRTKQYLLDAEIVNKGLETLKNGVFNSKDSMPRQQSMEAMEVNTPSPDPKPAIPKIKEKKERIDESVKEIGFDLSMPKAIEDPCIDPDWQATLTTLKGTLAPQDYDTVAECGASWLEGNTLRVTVDNSYVHNRLQHQLYDQIKAAYKGTATSIEFRIHRRVLNPWTAEVSA